MTNLKTSEIQTWLDYWQRSRAVAVDQILAFDQVHEARRFCSVMREGIFADVTDLQIWRALCDMRMTDSYPTPAPVFADADYQADIIGQAKTSEEALAIYRAYFDGVTIVRAVKTCPDRRGKGPVDGWVPELEEK